MHPTILLVTIVAFVLLPVQALGHHGKEYLITSTYKTPEDGGFFALWTSQYVESGHGESEYEFEPGILYGLTDRWSWEIHTHHSLTSRDFVTESIALETRLRIFGPDESHEREIESPDRARDPFSLAGLLEYEKGLDDHHDGVEGRLIVGREFRNISLVANLIGKKDLVEADDFHYGYAIGVRKNLTSTVSAGLELEGGFRRGDGFSLTPGLYGTIVQGLDFRLGPTIEFGDRPEEFQLRATFLYAL